MVKLKLPDDLFAVVQELSGRGLAVPGHIYCFWPTLETAEAWKEGMLFGASMKVVQTRLTGMEVGSSINPDSGRCDKHPTYKASLPPRGDCPECWVIWRAIGNPPPP